MSEQARVWSGPSTPDMNSEDLKYFCRAIEAHAGISLKASKIDLVRTRLRSRVDAHGCSSFAEYRKFLQSLPDNHGEWEIFTNLLTTNKTDFFREPKHFEYLVNTILPQWLESGETIFKVWSAASSTGEEAYTLAMVLHRHLPQGRSFKILASDIDTNVIATGKNAVYSQSKISEIPAEYRNYAELGAGEARGWFRMNRELKDRISFQRHNLIEATSPGENLFDLVLCRNVLIYFSPKTIEFVQRKLYSSTKPGGYFLIGHSESLQGISHDWQNAGSSVFRKAP